MRLPKVPDRIVLSPSAKREVPPPREVSTVVGFPGAFKLFRLAGTDVYLHFSWFIAAYFLIKNRPSPYSSIMWDVLEHVAGFVLVLLHEFGHVLACRQTGGVADRVVLWPLGGMAFVAPPPRPGANLWTTVAGPLVNLVLAPALILLAFLSGPRTPDELPTDTYHFALSLASFNLVMLVFNLLPIYPMDGGRILQGLLWFALGRAVSTAIAAWVGMALGLALGAWALSVQDWFLAMIAGFLVLGAFTGVRHAQLMTRMADARRREGLVCPNCGTSPPIGDYWRCRRCLKAFDLLADFDLCPQGGAHTCDGACGECGLALGTSGWFHLAAPETDRNVPVNSQFIVAAGSVEPPAENRS